MSNNPLEPLLNFLKFQEVVGTSLLDEKVVEIRHELAKFAADQFLQVAIELSKMESAEKNEITKAVSIILKIGSSLISGANDLFLKGNAYSASALVRQLVEVEYLAWAFENDENEAKKWILSEKEDRMKFFTPAKLRQAAQGKFRSKDYGYHCELGGHPVPGAEILLENSRKQAQLLLSDMLGHSGRIWDHLIGWACASKIEPILSRKEKMLARYVAWKKSDLTSSLPPPP